MTFTTSTNTKHQHHECTNKTAANQSLTDQQQNIVSIAALTAVGNLEQLKTQLNSGLDAGLTINEKKRYWYNSMPIPGSHAALTL